MSSAVSNQAWMQCLEADTYCT